MAKHNFNIVKLGTVHFLLFRSHHYSSNVIILTFLLIVIPNKLSEP